eukprot:9193258-Pyramimonas_sp.AAC.1
MSWRLTSRNATARESQASRRQPRASTDPAPRCQIGSSTASCPRRSSLLCDHRAMIIRVAGLLVRRN